MYYFLSLELPYYYVIFFFYILKASASQFSIERYDVEIKTK
jgi:hypothetical protein